MTGKDVNYPGFSGNPEIVYLLSQEEARGDEKGSPLPGVQLAIIRQMSGKVSRDSAGEYQADEQAGVITIFGFYNWFSIINFDFFLLMGTSC